MDRLIYTLYDLMLLYTYFYIENKKWKHLTQKISSKDIAATKQYNKYKEYMKSFALFKHIFIKCIIKQIEVDVMQMNSIFVNNLFFHRYFIGL